MDETRSDATTESETTRDFDGMHVAVVGLGRSGLAAARALASRGARLVLNDARSASEISETVVALRADLGEAIDRVVLGEHPVSLAERVDLIVVSPGVPFELPMLEAARRRGVETIGELEFAYRLSRAPFVAVTGTKGKSTTTTLLGAMLDDAVPGRTIVAGNIGLPLSEVVLDTSAEDLIVAEVSSFQLESIVTFRPRVAVVLNLSPDHLDRHVTMDTYIAAKRRIVENQRDDDVLVLNADDPIVPSFGETARARLRFFSVRGPVEAGAYLRDGRFVRCDGSREEEIGPVALLRVPGAHNHANALAAMAAAFALGATREAVIRALRGFSGLEQAYEVLGTFGGIRYVCDSKATNVAAVRAAIDATPPDGKIVLIMGGVDKGNEYDELFPVVRDRVRILVLLGPRTDRLEHAFRGIVPLRHAASMEEAVQIAAVSADKGDTVLLSPGHASFDLFTNWKERGNAFKDAVRRLYSPDSTSTGADRSGSAGAAS